MAARRYVPGDEPELTRRLDVYLDGLAARLGASACASDVEALVLSGGYGRGEGGVFRGADGRATLYNDLEFYVLLRRASAAAGSWCHAEAESGTRELGIDVEFKLLAADALRGAEPSMFYYDLASASTTVWGDAALIPGLRPELRDGTRIPAHEATRLLFNRGSGLFFSACALRADDGRVRDGFVERNHAKARLALGDAVLALNGRYHFLCAERGRRCREKLARVPPGWERLQAWHAEGVSFKLNPTHGNLSSEVLRRSQTELVDAWLTTFLWLEGERLGARFASAEDYACHGGNLYAGGVLRHILLHVRDRVRRGGCVAHPFDYPRGALQRALALLLADPFGHKAEATRLLGGRPGEDLESLFKRWWSVYN